MRYSQSHTFLRQGLSFFIRSISCIGFDPLPPHRLKHMVIYNIDTMKNTEQTHKNQYNFLFRQLLRYILFLYPVFPDFSDCNKFIKGIHSGIDHTGFPIPKTSLQNIRLEKTICRSIKNTKKSIFLSVTFGDLFAGVNIQFILLQFQRIVD